MKTFNDFSGVEGIDKLMECAPLVGELISDREIMEGVGENTLWVELGVSLYKAHTETCNKLFIALGNEATDNSMEIISGMTQILHEVMGNKEMLGFFASLNRKAKKSSGSVTESTEGEQ